MRGRDDSTAAVAPPSTEDLTGGATTMDQREERLPTFAGGWFSTTKRVTPSGSGRSTRRASLVGPEKEVGLDTDAAGAGGTCAVGGGRCTVLVTSATTSTTDTQKGRRRLGAEWRKLLPPLKQIQDGPGDKLASAGKAERTRQADGCRMGLEELWNAARALVVEAAEWASQNGRRPGDFKVPLAAGRSPDGEHLNGVPAYGF